MRSKICRRQMGQRGFISLGGLCILLVILLLGLVAARFMRSGGVLSAEHTREMQLRLAAESGIETAAAALERSSDAYGGMPPEGEQKVFSVGEVPMAAHIELYVAAQTPAKGQLHLIAVAVDAEESPVEDGEQWERGKMVRAWMEMEEKGHRYVWRCWF